MPIFRYTKNSFLHIRMVNETAFCSEDITYPLLTHAAIISVARPDASIVLFPNRKVHIQTEDIVRDIKELENSLTKDGEAYSILESCIVLPLRFSRLVPLKKEYWANPTETFADANRSMPFVKAIYNFSLFSMLVTPSKEGDMWRYQAALPISVGSSDMAIEQFMLHSDWPVAETAKHCALYTIEQPFLYNWIAHEHAPVPNIQGALGRVN